MKGGNKMVNWKAWTALVGGIVSCIGQFRGAGYYLPLIGGILSIIAAGFVFAKK
jgi:membrane protein implicated in regulation of membrane protease activity